MSTELKLRENAQAAESLTDIALDPIVSLRDFMLLALTGAPRRFFRVTVS